VDMWRPFTNSIEQWAQNCRIVYDKFHVLQHANKAIDEVRRAEFFRKGGRMRGVVKGKRWLLLTRWMNLDSQKRQQLNDLFALNRRVMKAYLLKESLERLSTAMKGHAALSAKLDRSTAMATVGTLSKTRLHAVGSPGRHPQLLPHPGTLRSGGSHQRQHQNPP
jgi:transposase